MARDALLAAAACTPDTAAAYRGLRADLYRLILHPGKSTGRHFAEFFIGSLGRSLAVNLPLYAVPALLVHRQRLLGRARNLSLVRSFFSCTPLFSRST